jgi:tetratricopeptide (TPR) repeat protein
MLRRKGVFRRGTFLGLLCLLLVAARQFAGSGDAKSPDPANWAEARESYQDGLRAEDEGRYTAAINYYSRVVQLDPADDSAFLHRGICYLARGEFERAIADLTQSLKLQPENSKAYQLRAVAHHRSGNFAEATADLDQAIQRNSTVATYYLLRGQTLAARRETAQAIDSYTQALALEPSAQAYLDRAEAHLQAGARERAFADLNRALTLGARLTVPAELAALVQRPRTAAPVNITAFGNIDAIRDRDALTRTLRARSWVVRGRYQEALQLFEEAIRSNPRLALTYNSRGYAYLRLRSYSEAIADFSTAIRLNDHYLNAYENRAAARRLTGDRAGYLEDLNRGRTLLSRMRSPGNGN